MFFNRGNLSNKTKYANAPCEAKVIKIHPKLSPVNNFNAINANTSFTTITNFFKTFIKTKPTPTPAYAFNTFRLARANAKTVFAKTRDAGHGTGTQTNDNAPTYTFSLTTMVETKK